MNVAESGGNSASEAVFGGLGSGFVWDYGKAGLLGKKGEADEGE
jgi:hypothetical protein